MVIRQQRVVFAATRRAEEHQSALQQNDDQRDVKVGTQRKFYIRETHLL